MAEKRIFMVTVRHGHEIWLYLRTGRGESEEPHPSSGRSFYRIEKAGQTLAGDFESLDDALRASETMPHQGENPAT